MNKLELENSIASFTKENASIKEEIEKENKRKDELDKINCIVKPNLAKSNEALSSCSSFYSVLMDNKVELVKLKEKIKKNDEDKKSLDEFSSTLYASLQSISIFLNNNLLAKSKSTLDELNKEKKKISSYSSYPFYIYLNEALDYINAKINLKMFASSSYSLEEANDLIKLISSLTTYYHEEILKGNLLDSAYVYLLRKKEEEESNLIHSSSNLINYLSFLESVDKSIPSPSLALIKEKEISKKIAINEYNELAKFYFEEEPNIECSLSLFRLKDKFSKEDITFSPYIDNENEESFRLCFLSNVALRKDVSSYNDQVLVLAKKANEGDKESFNLLVSLLCMKLIDSTKFDLTLKSLRGFSFSMLLKLFSNVVKSNLDEEKQVLLFNLLEKTKTRKRVVDLEEAAEPLYYLSFHIAPSLKDKFNLMKQDLLRSPKAHKIKTKSKINELHYLYKEDPLVYQPIGKKLKDTRVRSYDALNIVSFYFLTAVIPALVCIISLLLFYFLHIENYATSFIYALPLSIYVIFFGLIGYSYFGKDEKGSGVFRIIMGIDGILKTLIALIYFIIPTKLPFLSLWSMPLFVSGIFSYIASLIFFKERKKVPSYIIFLSELALVLLSIVFIIIDLRSSLIS